MAEAGAGAGTGAETEFAAEDVHVSGGTQNRGEPGQGPERAWESSPETQTAEGIGLDYDWRNGILDKLTRHGCGKWRLWRADDG